MAVYIVDAVRTPGTGRHVYRRWPGNRHGHRSVTALVGPALPTSIVGDRIRATLIAVRRQDRLRYQIHPLGEAETAFFAP
jgi:hypothetical protein